jgi:hypothetical protein
MVFSAPFGGCPESRIIGGIIMACKVNLSLLTESQVGNIGNDWKYTIEAKVFNEGLKGTGSISVAKHDLNSGDTQEPPGPPAPVDIPAGDCPAGLMIKLKLDATEVDFFKSDSGTNTINVKMDCPGEGDDPEVLETDVSVGVRESPGLVDETAVFTLRVRLVASCD